MYGNPTFDIYRTITLLEDELYCVSGDYDFLKDMHFASSEMNNVKEEMKRHIQIILGNLQMMKELYKGV